MDKKYRFYGLKSEEGNCVHPGLRDFLIKEVNDLINKEESEFKKDSDIYKKAEITRQTRNNIINGYVAPTLDNALKIGFTMRLEEGRFWVFLDYCGYVLYEKTLFNILMKKCIHDHVTLDEARKRLINNKITNRLL